MDEDRFRVLYVDTFEDVWRFVRRRIDSPEQADDVTAEVYATAWRRREDLPGEQARLWLFGTARNTLSNHHREATRRARLHLRIAAVDPSPESYDVAVSDGDQHGVQVWAALAALTAGDRDVLLMRAWDGLSISEIAALLEVAPAVVSSRLHKARARLRRELRGRDVRDEPDLSAEGHVPSEPQMERST